MDNRFEAFGNKFEEAADLNESTLPVIDLAIDQPPKSTPKKTDRFRIQVHVSTVVERAIEKYRRDLKKQGYTGRQIQNQAIVESLIAKQLETLGYIKTKR